MTCAGDHRVQAWSHSLREAVAARDEPLYRQHVVQFLITAEGVSFVERKLNTPAARGVMSAVYARLAPALGLQSPNDLLERMKTLDTADDNGAAAGGDGPPSLAATFMHYLRLGRDWARACRADASFGVALAVLLFEPLLVLFDAEGAGVKPVHAPAAAMHSFDRRVQFA
jgi:hypothetical protein